MYTRKNWKNSFGRTLLCTLHNRPWKKKIIKGNRIISYAQRLWTDGCLDKIRNDRNKVDDIWRLVEKWILILFFRLNLWQVSPFQSDRPPRPGDLLKRPVSGTTVSPIFFFFGFFVSLLISLLFIASLSFLFFFRFLHNNKLQRIPSGAFHNMESLKRL